MLAHPVRFLGDHRFVTAHASSHVDDELGPAAERRVARHAAVCPGCARLLAQLRRTVRGLGALPAPSSDAAPAVLEVLRREDGLRS